MTQTKPKAKETKVTVIRERAADTPDETSVNTFISQAIAANAPIETMERLFDLRSKIKAEAAKEAFVVALSNFQKDCPVIEKKKSVMNKDGRTLRYKFAPIDSIIEQIKDDLSANGLSYRWTVESTDKGIIATCVITHVLGHSETSSFTVPVEMSQYMTSPQSHASALTFAKRYSLCNALGIATGDEDTDAVDSKKEKDPQSPKAKIVFRLRTLNEQTATKEQVEEAVLRLTKLELAPENFDEIITRLEVVISDRHESN